MRSDAPAPSRRRLPRALRDLARRLREGEERGDASIETAIVFPFVILFTVMVVQAVMWYYAREVAQTAAREGVVAARTYGSNVDTGVARANEAAIRLGGSALRSPNASPKGSSATRITITVTGQAQSLIPGVDSFSVSQSASAPVEKWNAP
ncbi:TadE/TadG family type IV pilus assembly protein [Streptomyces sp. TLI_171]|uniref:TadE/TadG family type IV pilus assembly protein n=1 Tax=Streptomyces sp. TLI_171 TaxID=1938859 RepID=UPI000C180EEB|nr:TadE/TadG family type IV pilus assembly protein [Streptomyces sp. TLI_171]RKE02969.1 TadE-like protein [Streptomyces sp. TLI_171]